MTFQEALDDLIEMKGQFYDELYGKGAKGLDFTYMCVGKALDKAMDDIKELEAAYGKSEC